MTLTELAKNYGCDKLFSHSHVETYERILGQRKVNRLLEIGIGYEDLMKPFVPFYVHGASLRMWAEYYPEAEIWACDIRPETLINEGNIRSVVCDQSSGLSLANMVWAVTGELMNKLDVVIDDGSHVTEHQDLTASVLLPRMAKNSLYIIEDTYPDTGRVLAAKYGGYTIVGNKRPDDTLVIIQR